MKRILNVVEYNNASSYRSLSRIVPFDGLSFLGVNGWHDSLSETRVINLKNYQAEIQAKSEIEALGKKEIA
ncbi:hypothetical protein ACR1PO_06925 [Chryseobacterium sp. RRHN12]|uniref:hypothetical protein n=1 Tax=Chryseobacterium sp. RRHN12 TaxID=3437884 RepID=UPI002FC86552